MRSKNFINPLKERLDMKNKTFYITTPIYYPSGNLHIGHLYTTTLAWVLANYKKLNGYDVKMLTGADEHGQKIQEKAKAENISEQEYVDKMSGKFKSLWNDLDIEYDYFSRTTNKQHITSVAKQFDELLKKDVIYKGEYKGLYSIQDEEFLTKVQAKEKEGKYFHPESGHQLEEVSEESYFFKMSEYEEWILEYYKENPSFIIPKKTIKELVNNFLSKGLEDLSVTRSTFDWGVKVNSDNKHVLYVWLDALNNYITALGYNQENNSDFIKYWKNGDEIVHVVGKEITRFHGIYWPIILKSLNLRMPTKILSHGWIITKDGKMSKSKGNVVNPLNLLKNWDAEVLKYFFASQINIGQDGIFDEERLKDVYNSNLANNFGNLLSRTLAMYHQNFDSPIVHVKRVSEVHSNIREVINDSIIEYKDNFDSFNINKGLQTAISLSKELNGYIDISKPWTLKENKEELSIILNNLLNGIYAASVMLSVVMPKFMTSAIEQLNQKSCSIDLINDMTKFDNVIPNVQKIIFERKK